jgi:eukaryotic-like serine/threonine-protein kinase
MMKAAQVASSQEFLALLEKSGLVSEPGLIKARSAAEGSSDAKSLARQLIAESLLTRWQANQLLNGFGQLTVGKYRLLDQLGVGRLGREFLAEHTQLGRRVALKLVSRSLTTDPARLKTFLAEFRRTASLDHKHLVHAHDVDQEASRYYVVTEYVDGENLQQRVKRRGRFAAHEALDLLIQSAEGLAHAAAAGVLHGDLKPSNLLVDQHGSVKVADLGFAKLVDTAGGGVVGKEAEEIADALAFAPPEASDQVEGDLDARSDIFSLGQILYFLLTGELAGPSDDAEKRRISLAQRSAALPDEVLALYARFTALNPKQRPADWSDALPQLREAIEVTPASTPVIAAEAQPMAEQSPRPTKYKPPIAKALPLADSDSSQAGSDTVPVMPSVQQTAGEMPAFVIDTKDRSAGRRAAAQAAAPVVSTSPSAEAAPPPASSGSAGGEKPIKKAPKKIDPRLVIGGAVALGLVMLLLGGGALYWMLGRPGADAGNQQVAQRTGPERNQGNVSPAVAVKGDEVELNPAELNPSDVNPGGQANPSGQPASNPAAANPATPLNPPENPAGGASVEDPAVPPGEGFADTATATNTGEQPPAPEPMPAEEPDVPAANNPPTTDALPPMAEPMPAGPVGKPFEKLATLVELPPVSKQEPLALGEIHVSAEQLVIINLQGGESATRTPHQFALQNANNGADPRNWEVTLSKSGEATQVVATLHLKDNQFTFAWTAVAASNPAAPYFENCQLQLSSGADVALVTLRPSSETPPVAIDMEKGSSIKLPLENIPNPKFVRVEIVGLGDFPNAELAPDAVLEAKGTTYLWFGLTEDKRNLGLKIDTNPQAKAVEVKFTPYFRLDPQLRPVKLTRKTLPDAKGGLEVAMAGLTASSAAVQASQLSQERKNQDKLLFEQNLAKAQEQHSRVESALDLLKSVHQTATPHIRVVYQTDAGKVVLAQTQGAPEPGDKPADKKPADME